jgi:hypothetical protein
MGDDPARLDVFESLLDPLADVCLVLDVNFLDLLLRGFHRVILRRSPHGNAGGGTLRFVACSNA